VILVVIAVYVDCIDIKYVDVVPVGEAILIELKEDVNTEVGMSDLDVRLNFSLVLAELELGVVEVTCLWCVEWDTNSVAVENLEDVDSLEEIVGFDMNCIRVDIATVIIPIDVLLNRVLIEAEDDCSAFKRVDNVLGGCLEFVELEEVLDTGAVIILGGSSVTL
jgi:hypothetical protein